MSIIKLLNQVFPGWGGEDFFNWKYDNPFGESIILVENDARFDHPVAVRMFMAWQMQDSKNYKYNCFQATDSATHPSARGQGLFSKLTLEALKKSSKTGFVFNFPNKNSVNIYLKLGWALEESKKALYLPLYNRRSNIGSSILCDNVSNILATNWKEDKMAWRMQYLNVHKFVSKKGAEFLFRKKAISYIKLADVVYTEEIIDHSDIEEFINYLKREGYIFIRYIGFNTKFEEILCKGYRLTFRYGADINSVSYNKPQGYKLRLEMIDADYIN
ncbi:GNAT family N-acetyltransferase [Cobetia sp. MMG027]|uniref:GNAT family N-acetyltransferase n=1 Tax=Cobetia sp. MMG027 TaxID=3021980 RepID=UPI0022FED7F0|nr:GNAT family N-acetyltransferase [Cobetia sp. MMG027]MDA5565376.1 GNAT family N-acetyltransferase [Cobetia sp. MMG027]